MLAALIAALVLAESDRGVVDKLIVVRAPHAGATTGTLERFERSQNEWRSVAAPIRVVVGKKGIALGGSKLEGDLKTPAGTFRVLGATGYDAAPPPGTALTYVRATPALKCVDDPRSKYYNRVLDERTVKPDWASAEAMLLADDRYRRVLIIGYNAEPTISGKGSCIFFHVWRNAESPTAGCVAMPLADLELLMRWSDENTRVLIGDRRTPLPPAK